MKTSLFRSIALATALAVTGTSCGYIFHPERRGSSGGAIDGGVLVMDLLWLIPGVIPGVVFLIVDFTGGYMYVGGRMAMVASPHGDVAVKLLDQKQPMHLKLELVTESRRVLAADEADVGPDIHGKTVSLAGGESLRAAGEPVYVQITNAREPGHPVRVPVAL